MFTNHRVFDCLYPSSRSPLSKMSQAVTVASNPGVSPQADPIAIFIRLAKFGIALALLLIVGCVGGRSALVKGLDEVREEGKVVAIVRNNLEPDRRGWRAVPKYQISVASIDRGEELTAVNFVSLKDSRDKKEWLYLPLSPGTYFLDIEPRYRDRHATYWFKIGKDQPATYLGTLTHECLDASDLDCIKVVDEHDQMLQEVTATGLGGAATSLLRPYPAPTAGSSKGGAATNVTTPAPASSPGLAQKAAVGLVVGATTIVRTPDWRQRAVRRAILFDSGEDEEYQVLNAVGFDAQLLTGGGNPYVFIISAPAGALHLVYLPFGYSVGKIVGSRTEKKRRPCMEAFAQRTQRVDVTQAIRVAANQWAETHGVTKIATVSSVGEFDKNVPDVLLEFDSLLVRLRECGSVSSFCIELSSNVKVSLNGDQTQYNPYVYSHEGRKSGKRGYEIILDQKSISRDIDEYCDSADGIDKLITEVEKGIRAVTETALGDALGVPKPAVQEKGVPGGK